MAVMLGAVSACGTSDETRPTDGGLPAATGEVPPLDRAALQEGNRGLGCGSAALAERVAALLASMTLEQKIFEMHGRSPATEADLYLAGGDDPLGIPAFKMVDGPRGVRAGKATAFPVGMARGATFDPELERRVGLAIGLETAARGGNVLLAPAINLLRHPGWGRAQETYSEDTFHMGLMALGFVGGVQNHVLASAKHFAVNSVENTRFTMTADLDERTLREVYLPHFERVVREAKVGSVMSAYNRVNGTYCGEHPHLLGKILKGDWEFEGFVESDWFAGVRSTTPSALAGLDIEMPSASYYGPDLAAAVAAGEVPLATIDAAVTRILRQKLCFGLDAPQAIDPAVVESAEHRELAREVAERSMVLLKNQDAVLPLASGQKLVVVGALADVANLGDRGSSLVRPSSTVTPFAGISALGSDVTLVGTDAPTDAELELVAAADVAVVVTGLTYRDEGEFIPVAQEDGELARGGDRATLELPAEARALIDSVAARAKRTVVVLECGAAVTLGAWLPSVDALLVAWYPGMAGGTALARILFGEVSPSGKLPVTFARSMGDLPPWDITSDSVAYGYLHGYRLLDARGTEPDFPFGFGLGYSPFRLGRVKADRDVVAAGGTVRVSVDVMNAGERAGAEVVQIYVSAPGSSHERAPRDLRGFRRVALEPGEVKTVHVDVSVADLTVWDEAASRFEVERQEYVAHVGTSSRDFAGEVRFRVE